MDIQKTISKLRNIAIIAHVDHGKTTLVDCMLRQSGVFRDNEIIQERVLDSNDLERERGITILAKNISVSYNDYTINVVDTPGHADFGGEVERVLGMVDGALLLIDAAEGPMPQTRFVLSKALELKLKIILVVNKIDRQGADPNNAVNKAFDLFVELTDNPELIDFPIIYTNSISGVAKYELDDNNTDFKPLFDTIIKTIKPPEGDINKPLQFHVRTLDYNNYIGRIAIGRIHNGKVRKNEQVSVINREGQIYKGNIIKLIGFVGLKSVDLLEAHAGCIVGIAGFPNIQIGETISSINEPNPLPLIDIDEPTLEMNFSINDSPFAGKEGKYVTSRHLRSRLFQELEKNISLRVEKTENTDVFKVSGRGELHLSILIETMRREGYEFQVSKPMVIFKEIEGNLLEPFENLFIDLPDEYSGSCIEKLASRKATMKNLMSNGTRTIITFDVPSRGLIGYRSEFIRMTKGEGIMYHTFNEYKPFAGEITFVRNGSLVAHEDGTTFAYALQQLEDRGDFFIRPKTKVYRGMIVGENNRTNDLLVNVCKAKRLTNVRSSTADVMVTLSSPRELSLEDCLEYINEDELVEITPENIRMRKRDLKHLK